MTHSIEKQDFLEALIKIRDEGPTEYCCGICSNMEENVSREHSHLTEGWLEEQFPKWSEFSGDINYPITDGSDEPNNLYNTVEELWSTTESYGQARWRLLDFLIATLVEEDHKA